MTKLIRGRNAIGSKRKIRDAEYQLREKKRQEARMEFSSAYFSAIAQKMGLNDNEMKEGVNG